MDFLIRFLKHYWTYVVIALLTLLLMITTGYIFLDNNSESETNNKEIGIVLEEEEVVTDTLMVDVKGAVKKPGVYAFLSGQIINDAISAAGGFTSKAYSKNINLSKKLSDEMVLYVFTKTEYKNLNTEEIKQVECVCPTYEIDNCLDEGSSVIEVTSDSNNNASASLSDNSQNKVSEETNESANKKVSINSATKEELMTLNGIGEAKAESIISYREKNGAFKSLEDIKNVSGIGDAAYEKIKDNITL